MLRFGIDLGGTKTEIIALNNGGNEVYRKRIATDRTSYQTVLDGMTGLVNEAEESLGQKGTVGIGIPGCISAKTGLVKNAESQVLNGNALDNDLRAALGREIRCANDANCFAVSEATDGAAKGYQTVFAVIVGTGCGAGLTVNAQALHGLNFVAGEWGHNPLPWMTESEFRQNLCWCGQYDCLETWISGTGFEKDYARYMADGQEALQGPEIAKLAEAGDQVALETLQRYADRMARGLAHVINIIDPDAIVLGGGMSNIDMLYDMVSRRLEDYVFGGECDTPIVKNMHGDSSGVRGAAWLWPANGCYL